jgi:2-polyprenyl-3-methyl-5-hydroxy-6-metoxy-1,4-benzoquinol methylase
MNGHKSTLPGSMNYGTGENSRVDVQSYVPLGLRSLLDVGCAGGLFGEALIRSRPELCVDGVEPNPEAALAARQRLNSVYTGFFPEAVPAGATYDCISFLDVLEHLVDPWEALLSAKKYLAPGGHVLASIPNVRHVDVVAPLLFKGRFQYGDFGILDRTHLRFFTKASILELFQNAGFMVTTLGRVQGSLGTGRPYRITRRFGRIAREFTTINYVVVASVSSDTEQ